MRVVCDPLCATPQPATVAYCGFCAKGPPPSSPCWASSSPTLGKLWGACGRCRPSSTALRVLCRLPQQDPIACVSVMQQTKRGTERLEINHPAL